MFTGIYGETPGMPTILWDFGDGFTTEGILNPTHIYADDSEYTVTFTVTDDMGASGWDSIQASISNVEPEVTVAESITVEYMDPLVLSGSFTDPGFADTHNYRWEISPVSGVPIVTIWGNLDITVNWLEWLPDYPAPGQYVATLIVEDDDGGIGAGSCPVTIVRKPTIITTPNSEIAYGGSTSISVNLTDDDYNELINQGLFPKTGYLDYKNSQGVWTAIDDAVLSGKTLTFDISMPEGELPGEYQLRARFNGDTFYAESEAIGTLTILKITVVLTLAPASGYTTDTVVFEATVLDDEGNAIPTIPVPFNFTVGGSDIGSGVMDSPGHVQISWVVDLVATALTEEYPTTISLPENNYVEAAPDESIFTLLSPKYLKIGAIAPLEGAKGSKPRIDRDIDTVLELIQDSLNDALWLDTSHLDHNSGKEVFQKERTAVSNLLKLANRDSDNEAVYLAAAADLVRTDELLAIIIIEEARQIHFNDPVKQQEVETHLQSAESELVAGQAAMATDPADAITNFMQAWEQAQQVFLLID